MKIKQTIYIYAIEYWLHKGEKKEFKSCTVPLNGLIFDSWSFNNLREYIQKWETEGAIQMERFYIHEKQVVWFPFLRRKPKPEKKV